MGDISIKGRSPLLKGGRVGFDQGLKVKQIDPLAARLTEAGHMGGAGKSLIKKGTKIRKEYAQYKKDFRLKTKLEKAKAAREQQKKQAEFQEKYIKPASPETKVKISKQIAPKSWARAGKS